MWSVGRSERSERSGRSERSERSGRCSGRVVDAVSDAGVVSDATPQVATHSTTSSQARHAPPRLYRPDPADASPSSL